MNKTIKIPTKFSFSKVVMLLLFICLQTNAQNAIVGSGFSTGWGGSSCSTGNGNFKYLSLVTGTGASGTYGVTTTANGTGDQFFRFGVDWGGTTAQLTKTIGSDDVVAPNTTYSLNTSCTTSGALKYNVPNASYNYVFKTLNAGSAPTGTFVFFEVQGAVRSVSSVTQLPLSSSVTTGAAATVTATLDGALATGQAVYLRYTKDNYANSTVVQMTGSGTSYTASIPAAFNTSGANVSYYVFTSGTANVAANGSNADLYTINLNNNGGSNYAYTVTTPTAIYVHNFGTTTISTHPYTVAPTTFATNLSSSSWSNSVGTWTSFAGSAGQAIAIQPGTTSRTITMTFSIAAGNSVTINSLSYWRQRSNTTSGTTITAITINGITVSTGTDAPPGTGSVFTNNAFANPVVGLTGTVTVVMSLSAPSASGTNLRLDDFTLNGNVVAVPVSAPVVTSGSPTGTFNSAFNYSIVASNSPNSYAVASGALPPGLTLNTTTGAITGTPTAAGSYTANVTATNSGGTSSPAALNFTIAKANQTITFATLATKNYGDASFTLSGTSTSGLTVTYASSNAAVATVSGNTVTLVGAGTTNITASQAGNANYNAAADVVRAQVVNTKALTITGVTAANKVQDGTTTATLVGAPGLSGLVAGDESSVSITGTPTANFATALPGTGIAVTVTGYSLSGVKASSYTVSQPTGLTANITALGTPIATAASAILPVGFKANWNSVSDATSYLLDVSLYPDFQTGGGSTTLTEGFTLYNSNTTFNSFAFTGTGIYSTAASSGTTGPNSVQFNDTNDRVVSPLLSGSATQLSFWLKSNSWNTGAGNNFLVEGFDGTNWVTIQNIPSTSVATTNGPTGGTLFSYNATSTPALPAGLTQFRFTITKTTGNVAFDDFSVTYNTSVPSFISGYDGLNVGNVTSHTVTGLTPETTYYYRVRAVRGTFNTANSNAITVTTKPTVCTWNGSAWTNVTGPDADIEAVIAGVYNTAANGEFTAKKVTVNSGSLTVNSGNSITVVNEVVNNLTAADLVVESNANLIQTADVDNTGAITVNRNSSLLKRLDYTLWSSPVVGQNLLNFSPQTLTNRFYLYNSTTNFYESVPSPSTTTFEAGKGFLIRVPNNHPAVTPTAFAGQFVGVPHNGDYSVAMQDAVAGERFNLVGNPYPSPINALAFIEDINNSSSITGTLYFWRKTNGSANPSYCTWTSGGFVTNNDDQTFNLNDVIQTGQAFFVEATGTNNQLLFTNTMRTDNNANQFFRNAQATNAVERHRVWLNATNGAGAFSQTMIGYMTNASNGLDAQIDGKYINDGEIAFTSLIDATPLAIQGRALPFDVADVVPMRFKATTSGTYTITIDHTDGLFANDQIVFLRDNVTGVTHNLSDGAYSFAVEAGTFDSRFEVVYQSTLGTDTPTLTQNQVVVYAADATSITVATGTIMMSSIKVFDIRGRLLTESNAINTSQATLVLPATNQVVLLQITTNTGETITKKFVK